MLDLKIDPQAKQIQVTVQIKGQPQPIRLTVHDYELVEEQGKQMLRWSSIVVDAAAVELPPGMKSKLQWIM